MLIGLLFAGGVAAWVSEKINPNYPRAIALITMLLGIVLVLVLLNGSNGENELFASVNASWLPRFGISFYLAADGLSALLLPINCISWRYRDWFCLG